jgi:hypothetical protein
LIHLSSYSNGVESTSAAASEATTTTPENDATDKQTVPNNNFQINFDLYKFPKLQSPKK